MLNKDMIPPEEYTGHEVCPVFLEAWGILWDFQVFKNGMQEKWRVPLDTPRRL